MMPIIYSTEALEDVQKILVYLEEQEPRLVAKFESDYRRALEGIRGFPHAWPKAGRSIRGKAASSFFFSDSPRTLSDSSPGPNPAAVLGLTGRIEPEIVTSRPEIRSRKS